MPAVAVVGLILLGERDVPQTASSGRFRGLMRLVVPFSCGVLTPVIVFLAPYARSGAVGQFFSGVTSSAIARSVGLGVLRPVAIEKCVYALALAGVIAAAMYLRELQSKAVGVAVAFGLGVMLSKATTSGGIVSGVWYSVATLTPLVALMGVWVLRTRPKSGGLAKIQRQRLMVLVSLAAMCGLCLLYTSWSSRCIQFTLSP